MHGIIRFFRLPLKINTRLNQIIKPPVHNEKPLRGGPPPAFKEYLLDNQDLGQKLHISQRTLMHLRVKGRIRYIRINREYYYLVGY